MPHRTPLLLLPSGLRSTRSRSSLTSAESGVGDERDEAIASTVRRPIAIPRPIAEANAQQLVARAHAAHEDDVSTHPAIGIDTLVGEERRVRHRSSTVHRHFAETGTRWLAAGYDRDVLIGGRSGNDNRHAGAVCRLDDASEPVVRRASRR